MPKNNKATVYTVAKHAGVSIATVSRTLAQSPKVKQETRERVLKAVEELNFQPDPSARRLAYKTTETVALVFPDISGPYYSSVIRGVEQEGGKNDYNILIYGTHGKGSSGRFLRSLISKVDGLIIMARSIGNEALTSLLKEGIPFVLLSRSEESIPYDMVKVNNREGAASAAAHLIAHGHRQIAIISGPQDSPDSQERLQGYQKAIFDANLVVPSDLILEGNFQYESGRAAMSRILKAASKPSAILAANDEMALGAMDRAREEGLQIPGDLAVIGFDDIQIAALVRPSLTTVHQPMEQLGEMAFKLLYNRLKNTANLPHRKEILDTRLVVRQTCGCPPLV